MVIFEICFIALLSAIATTANTAEFGRANTRASQIMTEKLDTLRLYAWSQLTTPGYIDESFTCTQFVTNGTPNSSPGITYTGKVIIADAPMTESYKSKMKQVTVEVSWSIGGRAVKSQMSTLVGEYGLQTYIY